MPHRGDTSDRDGLGRREGLGGAASWARDGGGATRGRDAGERREAVLARIRATPPGFVRTYGDVSPGAPRFAGAVLHGDSDPDLPWFRIVRADGSLTQGDRQRRLLEAEGVPFRGERVDMRAARVP
ncbi:MGMT family protein [Candidatus Solirubrobacter pratensis]|uniref:MGMT family protein n=1 Tax=Candidatus Solirubrobacter pratensis TaxID=1298857 RepID=UPI0009DBC54B|nr:MGMT family protein [Candidatus Solirubrobacter pratensis]